VVVAFACVELSDVGCLAGGGVFLLLAAEAVVFCSAHVLVSATLASPL
jgi:hypothetical protein